MLFLTLFFGMGAGIIVFLTILAFILILLLAFCCCFATGKGCVWLSKSWKVILQTLLGFFILVLLLALISPR